LAGDPDEAAVLFDDAIDDRQAHTGFGGVWLGRVEGVEDLGLGFGDHAAAGVAEREAHVIAGRREAVVAVEMHIGGLNRHGAFTPHGVTRIVGENDQDLGHLIRIDHDRPQRLAGPPRQLDVRAEGLFEGFGHGADRVVEIDAAGQRGLPRGEPEQALDQRRGMLAGLEDRRQRGFALVVGRSRLADQFGVADDHGEGVVEVMRHAAGHAAQGL
jgi:hypothetical protein